MENARIEKDTFNTLDELQEKESQLEKNCGIQTSVTHDFILLFKLCYKDSRQIQYSIKVASDLTVTVYLQGVQVKRSLVLEIASTNLNACTALNNFIVEQLALTFKSRNGRRYSSSLLAMSALLQRMSPTSYKQMYSGGFLTLPSPHHLRRLC